MKSPILRVLGLRIMKFRTERGWSREELAARVHVDPKHIYDIEAGKTNASWLVLASIRENFGCDWNTLMDGVNGACEACEEQHQQLAQHC